MGFNTVYTMSKCVEFDVLWDTPDCSYAEACENRAEAIIFPMSSPQPIHCCKQCAAIFMEDLQKEGYKYYDSGGSRIILLKVEEINPKLIFQRWGVE